MVAPPAVAVAASQPEVEQRVRESLPLVGYLVRETLSKVPAHVNRDDLTSAGMLALTLSAQNFDPTRGVPFAAYAKQRIRGALLDELRAMDWAPRSVRRTANEADTVHNQLTTALGRTPTKAEQAAAMGIRVAELAAAHANIAQAATTSFDALPANTAGDMLRETSAGPEALLLHREQLAYLHHAIAELPERLRHVIVEHFFTQRHFDDIATDLGVSPSRISQLYAEALRMIRDGMNSQLEPTMIDHTPISKSATIRRTTYRQAIAERGTLSSRLALTTPHGDLRTAPAFAVA